MDEVEKLKLEVVDFLIKDDFGGAVNHVRDVAKMVGLKAAYEFVEKVKEEVGENANRQTNIPKS